VKSSYVTYAQGHVSPQSLPPLPEGGVTAERDLLADTKVDDISLASAHTPTDEAEESEQEEETQMPPPKRRRADEIASTADSSPPASIRGEDADSSSTDSGEPKEEAPVQTTSPAGSPAFEACFNYNALMDLDDDEPT